MHEDHDDDRYCVREWKRDGTKHYMTLEDAAHVARSNPMPQTAPPSLADAAKHLRAWCRLETPLSYLYLDETP
jgi:hypothetical protein